ncbi:MAG: peptide chain release factor 2 [candidate division NC10 bacterium]|nr:peptide chain release factor 2 [candidate division NC10 bacterium]MBI4413506.1 peptide chain release factor 2 [candidate division NC10 bacterium]
MAGKRARARTIQEQSQAPDFWKDPEAAQRLLKELRELNEQVGLFEGLERSLEEQAGLYELARAEGEESLLAEIGAAVEALEVEVGRLELTTVLSGKHDRGNAILSINPGAGGTESQDWAQMLLRMYLRWAEGRGFRSEVLDLQPGEEAGIKGATVTVSGLNAYGYLKAETGVHRLVRISPFDASRRRHTSFASVYVYPELEEDIQVVIDDRELRIDTFRSSGAGGQHVNVTDSAVRITHLPTGIVVSCQNERSQHKNRAVAMKVLRARLYERARQEQEQELDRLGGEKKEIAWGSQIRSYVLAPYQLVKDHRTGVETGNVDGVLDGRIDSFIEAYLFQAQRKPEATPRK